MIQIFATPKNGQARRLVILRNGRDEYRDSIDTDSGFQRQALLERAAARFDLATEELQPLDAEIVKQADVEDEREEGQQQQRPIPLMVRLDTVTPENIEWLWHRRIAIGKVNLLVGDPGLGKSLVSLDWTARVTTGRAWPDGAVNSAPGGVVLLSFEDDVADTIRPRLDAAGADVSRVVLLQGISTYDPNSKNTVVRPFDLQRDIAALGEAVTQTPDCRLVVVDPISACLGQTDSQNNAEVRAALVPLTEIAQKCRVAILGVTHLSKANGPAIYRAMGSLAFVAAARSVWVVTKDRQEPINRLVLPLKNNLAPDVEGMSYQVVELDGQPVLSWSKNPVTVTVDEALAPEIKSARVVKHREVEDWLRELLSHGPVSADEIHDRAKGAGHSIYVLRSAKDALGIVPYREGFGRGAVWYWRLPAIDVESVLTQKERIYAFNGADTF